MQASAVDTFLQGGKRLKKAVTSCVAQILLVQSQQRTVVTAGSFTADFTPQNRLKNVFGSPDTRIVSSTPGLPDRITTSHDLSISFNNQGAITSVDQSGDFRYEEGQRTALAERAHYT